MQACETELDFAKEMKQESSAAGGSVCLLANFSTAS